ncbi:6081_t:CDS:2, partial [Scutellospora calospora]
LPDIYDPVRAQGTRIDYHLTRAWEKGQAKRRYKQTFLNSETINRSINGNITCGNFTGSSNKRGEEEIDSSNEKRILKKNRHEIEDRQIILLPRTLENQDLYQNHDDSIDDENSILLLCVPDDDFQKVTELIVGKDERSALVVEGIDLETTFEQYRNEYENSFDLCCSDIMDLRLNSKFTEKISETILEKFPKDSLFKWIKCWCDIHVISGENEGDDNFWIKDAIYNILAPLYAPYNILKLGDLEENQFNAQFVNQILNNALDIICNVDWRM